MPAKKGNRRHVKDSLYAFGDVGEKDGWEAAFSEMFDSKRDLKTVIKRLREIDKQR